MVSLSLTRYHVPAAVLLLVGLVVLGYAGVNLFDLQRTELHYSVEAVGETDVPGDAEVREYANLSSTAQGAFRGALEDTDGEFTGRERAPDLTYAADDASVGRHYVRYEGEYYRFQADEPGGLGVGLAVWFYLVVTVPIGAFVSLLGAGSVVFDRVRFPLTVLTGILAVVANLVTDNPNLPLGIATVALSMALAWWSMVFLEIPPTAPVEAESRAETEAEADA